MYRYHLKKSKEFKLVFLAGNKKTGKYIITYLLPNQQDISRIGFIVKKDIGKAVLRNKIKRRLREIWRKRCHKLITGYDIIVLAKKRITQASYKEIETELEKLLQNIEDDCLSEDRRMSLNE